MAIPDRMDDVDQEEEAVGGNNYTKDHTKDHTKTRRVFAAFLQRLPRRNHRGYVK